MDRSVVAPDGLGDALDARRFRDVDREKPSVCAASAQLLGGLFTLLRKDVE